MFSAIQRVLATMAGSGDANALLRQHYEEWDQILRTRRADLSAVMSAIYELIPSEARGTGVYEFDVPPRLNFRKDADQTQKLICVRVAGSFAMLMMRKDWVPATLTPLSEVRLQKPENLPPEPASLRRDLAHDVVTYLEKRCDDAPTYHIAAIDPAPTGLALTLRDSSYHRYYNGCEALSWELAQQWNSLPGQFGRSEGETLGAYAFRLNEDVRKQRASPREGILSVQSHFDRMTHLLRTRINPLDLSTRSVGIGVNTLTVLCRRGHPPVFPLHLRGVAADRRNGRRRLAEAAGTVHVIPAGTFQRLSPIQLQSARVDKIEMNLERNVLREFCEEILDKEELIRSASLMWDPDQVFRDIPELAATKQLFEEGRARSFFLGCGLDLVSTKLEVLTLLLVDADAFDSNRIHVHTENDEGTLENREMRRFDASGLADAMSLPNLLAAGAGCIGLAHAKLEEITLAISELMAEPLAQA